MKKQLSALPLNALIVLFSLCRCAIEVYIHLYDHPLQNQSADEQISPGKTIYFAKLTTLLSKEVVYLTSSHAFAFYYIFLPFIIPLHRHELNIMLYLSEET